MPFTSRLVASLLPFVVAPPRDARSILASSDGKGTEREPK
jgi:hypothetical protein